MSKTIKQAPDSFENNQILKEIAKTHNLSDLGAKEITIKSDGDKYSVKLRF